jgi:hypothetical protein
MPSTYTLISSNTLTTATNSVTFSAIPSTFTDLVVRFAIRADASSTPDDTVSIRLNGLTTSIYSDTNITGNGSTVTSTRTNNQNRNTALMNGGGTTANTFNNGELYITNYNGSLNKTLSGFYVQENNATSATILSSGHLSRLTSAITSIAFSSATRNFVAGSSFYLYGIKNS